MKKNPKITEWKKPGFTAVLMLITAQAFGQSGLHGVSAYLDPYKPGYCGPAHSDPRCSYSKIHNIKRPQLVADPCNLTACQVIENVRLHATGHYICQTGKLAAVYTFNCDHLVDQLGASELKGVRILVRATGEDMCHKPGSCSTSSCMNAKITAEISAKCPQPEQ